MQAGSYSEQAAAMAVEVNELTLQGNALVNRAEAYRELGQYSLANVTAARALALLRSSGYRPAEAIVLDNMGLVESSLGNYAEAVETTKAALVIARQIGSRPTEASALLHLGTIYTKAEQLDAAEQALIAANGIVHELGEESAMLEVQAALANLALVRGGKDDLDKAHTDLNELVQILLQEPPHEKTRFLPLWLYLTCIRVMRACSDPRAEPLIARADAELRARSEKISDAALRIGYLNIPEHRAILDFAEPA